MYRKQRLAACEPCRIMKQACDHAQPTCDRCRRRGGAQDCVYRQRPFKKQSRTGQEASNLAPELQSQNDTVGRYGYAAAIHTEPRINEGTAAAENSRVTPPSTVQHSYPSSGYLGSSSHITIFNHIVSAADEQTENLVLGLASDPANVAAPHDGVTHDDLHCADLRARVKILDEIASVLDFHAASALVSRWVDGGANLALGGPLVKQCLLTVQQSFLSGGRVARSTMLLAKQLSANSAKFLSTAESTCFSDFSERLDTRGLSWELLALSLTAVARAALDIVSFSSLYKTEEQGRSFQKKLCDLADRCLEVGLGLDCINDLTLVVQYEVWILYTMADGNQGYNSWRRLGDVIGSLLFLGHHEKIISSIRTSLFAAEFRRTVFAWIYTADKNIAVYLGRPPRLTQQFCYFQIPRYAFELLDPATGPPEDVPISGGDASTWGEGWTRCTELRWSAFCASLKEEVIAYHRKNIRSQTELAALEERVSSLWLSLPPGMRLQGNLETLQKKSVEPLAREMMLNARLTYLQVLFLLHGGASDVGHKSPKVFAVAEEMLSLIVWSIVFRDRLVLSSTGLVWKIAHYGLPAAGVISLSMLQTCSSSSVQVMSYTTIQNLTVVVTEIQGQGFVTAGAPNYALLNHAASTVSVLLQQYSKKLSSSVQNIQGQNTNGVETAMDDFDFDSAFTGHEMIQDDGWGYEHDFWRYLEQQAEALPGQQ